MLNNPVFIVTSTINTPLGLIDPATRYSQTLDTIKSIRDKVKGTILFVEKSTIPLSSDQQHLIERSVDHYIYIGDRTEVIYFNSNGIKGAGETYMLLVALDFIKTNNILTDRIFKLSGRYKLSENFNIDIYNKTMIGQYCFKTRDQHDHSLTFLHTRMWSFCISLLDDTRTMLQAAMKTHLIEEITIEEAIYKHINLQKLIELKTINCEGYIAPWNELILD
jgi:hypothetical protein